MTVPASPSTSAKAGGRSPKTGGQALPPWGSPAHAPASRHARKMSPLPARSRHRASSPQRGKRKARCRRQRRPSRRGSPRTCPRRSGAQSRGRGCRRDPRRGHGNIRLPPSDNPRSPHRAPSARLGRQDARRDGVECPLRQRIVLQHRDLEFQNVRRVALLRLDQFGESLLSRLRSPPSARRFPARDRPSPCGSRQRPPER